MQQQSLGQAGVMPDTLCKSRKDVAKIAKHSNSRMPACEVPPTCMTSRLGLAAADALWLGWLAAGSR